MGTIAKDKLAKSRVKTINCLRDMKADFQKTGVINKPDEYSKVHSINRALQTYLQRMGVIKKIAKNKWVWTSNLSFAEIEKQIRNATNKAAIDYNRNKRLQEKEIESKHEFTNVPLIPLKEQLRETLRIYNTLPSYLSNFEKETISVDIAEKKFN